MGKSEYIKKVQRQVCEKVKKEYGSKITISLFIVGPLLLSALIFLLTYYFFTPYDAWVYLLSAIIPYLSEIFIALIFYSKWRFWDVPEEIYNEQKDTIDKYQSDELKISFVEFEPRNNEGNPGLCISVKNDDTRKIIEIEAKIEMVLHFFSSSENEILAFGWRIPSFNILEQSEIRPDTTLAGIIITFSDDFLQVKFGKSQDYYSIISNEAIYKISIKYSGKIEGEIYFKYKIFEVDIYVNTSKKILSSAHLASELGIINEDFKKKFIEFQKKNRGICDISR